MSLRLLRVWLAWAVFLGLAAPALADDPGEAELLKAIELKIKSENLFKQEEVVARCRKALELGLTGDNKVFCEKLLVATLIDRGGAVARLAASSGGGERLRKMALEDLEGAVKIDPKASEAYLAIGRLKIQAGDRKAAQAALSKVVELEKAAGENGNLEALTQALMLRAQTAEDPKAKLADFNEALKINPKNADLLRTRGQMLLEEGKVKEALADFENAVKLDPKDAESHQFLGTVQAALGKSDEALKSLSKAIELAPSLPFAYLQRGRLYLRLGKGQEALNDLNKVLALVRPTAELLLMRAAAYQTLGNEEKALKDVEAALKLKPDDANTLLQVGTFYYSAKKTAKAIEVFTTVIAKSPKNASAYAGRADAYLQAGEHAKATADYAESLKHEADNTHVLNNLSWVLSTSPDDKVRDGRRAIELAKKACELTEYKEAYILSTLAAGYAETGDFEMAIKWSKKAVELGEGSIKDNLKKELESYLAKKPWREKSPPEK
jgi:tetratricopeptide (TPR) repeat protein